MIVKELYPNNVAVEINPSTSAISEAEVWYPKLLGNRFNYVIDVNSNTSGNSDLASNELDRYFLKVIRSQSDLIITTGETAREERLSASTLAPLAIITRQPDNLCIPATMQQSTQAVIISSTDKPSVPYPNQNAKWQKITGATLSEAVLEISDVSEATSVVLETGLESLKELVSSNILNEICLTVTGAATQEEAEKTSTKFLESLRCKYLQVQLLNWGSSWFFRFKVLQQSS